MRSTFILAVAAGGALGSVARYLVGIGSGKLFWLNFPWGTLIINVTGSFLIGLFIGLFATRWDLPQAMRVFLTVGFCGGYTCAYRISNPGILMMQSAQDGTTENASGCLGGA